MRSAPPVSDKGPVPSPLPRLREPPPGSRVVSRYSCLSVSSFRKRERERGEGERETNRARKKGQRDRHTDRWSGVAVAVAVGVQRRSGVERGLSELDGRKTAAAGSAEWTKLFDPKKKKKRKRRRRRRRLPHADLSQISDLCNNAKALKSSRRARPF